MGQPLPIPAIIFPFVSSHTQLFLLPSPITYIFQCAKSYKVYMNVTKRYSFLPGAREGTGWLRHRKSQQAPAEGEEVGTGVLALVGR